MISPEKERIKFIKAVDVNEGEKKGNVERWLLEIEVFIKNFYYLLNKGYDERNT